MSGDSKKSIVNDNENRYIHKIVEVINQALHEGSTCKIEINIYKGSISENYNIKWQQKL